LSGSHRQASGFAGGILTEIQAKSVDEPRWLVIGLIDGKVWSAVITYRSNVIRLISVRRARKAEEDLYEG
jgi:uncharacterized DUF497 family protein